MEAWLGELRPYAGEPRTSAGWRLMKSSWRLLRTERALALGAVLASLTLAAPLLAGLFVPGAGLGLQDGHVLVQVLASATVVCAWMVAVFAIAAAADASVDGLPMDLREALEEARNCLDPLLRWALISLAVWLAARISGAALDAPWLVVLIEVPWFLATLLVVPAIVILGLGPGEALVESLHLIRDRWREPVAGLFGLGVFIALASFPASAILSHAAALNQSGYGEQHALAIVGVLLLAAVLGVGLATREVFAVLLLREALDDLPGHEYAGPRLRRRTRAARIVGLFLIIVAAAGGLGAITENDRRVNDLSDGPGANFTTVVSNPRALRLETGASVFYERTKIGVVLGTQAQGTELRVTFRVEPGYGPDETPGAFFLAPAGPGCPCLVLIPSATQDPPGLSES